MPIDLLANLVADAPAPAEPAAGHPRFNFTGGHNDAQMIPAEALAEAAAAAVRREGRSLAMYHMGGEPLGHVGLRQVIAEKLARRRGIATGIGDILVTGGSNHAIDYIARVFVAPGDTVLVEEFCYEGALKRFRNRGARLAGMKLDADGIEIGSLSRQLADMAAAGTVPRLIYTIPTVQNPTGSILPLDRRRALLARAREYGIPIVEDECYADVIWSRMAPPPALKALEPDGVIHVGSFSKSLAPAVRLGYAVANREVLARMLPLKTDGGTGALDQIIVAEFARGCFDAHVTALGTALERKMQVMLEALAREFGTAAECTAPRGGLFVWVRLQDGIDVRLLVGPAAEAGISFNPGPQWAVEPDAATSCLRLCFALPSEEEIREGIAALARVCHEVTGLPARISNVAAGPAEAKAAGRAPRGAAHGT